MAPESRQWGRGWQGRRRVGRRRFATVLAALVVGALLLGVCTTNSSEPWVRWAPPAPPPAAVAPWAGAGALLERRALSANARTPNFNATWKTPQPPQETPPETGESLRDVLFGLLSKSDFAQIRNLPRRVQPYWDLLSSIPATLKVQLDGDGNLDRIEFTDVSRLTVELPPRITLWNPHGVVRRLAVESGAKITFQIEATVELFGRNTTLALYEKIGDWYVRAERFNVGVRAAAAWLPGGARLSRVLDAPVIRMLAGLELANTTIVIPLREQAYFAKLTGVPVIPVVDAFAYQAQVMLGWVNALPIAVFILYVDPRRFSEGVARVEWLRHVDWTLARQFFAALPIVTMAYTISISNLNFSEYGDMSPDYFDAAEKYFAKTIPGWYSNPMSRGHSLSMVLRAPRKCAAGQEWCHLLRWALGDNSYLFSASLTDRRFIEFRADLRRVRLGFVTLEPAAALIALNPEWPHWAVFGQFNHTVSDGQQLRFRVEVGVAAANLLSPAVFLRSNRCGVSVSLDGLWARPFGIPWLVIGNAHLRGVGRYGVPWRDPLDIFRGSMGAEFYIGRRCLLEDRVTFNASSGCITGSGDVMVDQKNFLAEFFQFRINRLTLGDLAANVLDKPALRGDQSNSTQSLILGSGFPEGLNVSFAWVPTVFPYRRVPQGFVLQAPIMFLGHRAWAHARIAAPQPAIFLVDVYTPPMVFGPGGGVKLFKSAQNRTAGPRVLLDVALDHARVDTGVFVSVYGWFEGWFSLALRGRVLQLETSRSIPGWIAQRSRLEIAFGERLPSGVRWEMQLDLPAVPWFADAVTQVAARWHARVRQKQRNLRAVRLMLSDGRGSVCSDDRIETCVRDACLVPAAGPTVPGAITIATPLGNVSYAGAHPGCVDRLPRIVRMCRFHCALGGTTPPALFRAYKGVVDGWEKRLDNWQGSAAVHARIPFVLTNATVAGALEDYLHAGSFSVRLDGEIWNATAQAMAPWTTTFQTSHQRLLESMGAAAHRAGGISSRPANGPSPVRGIIRDALAALARGISGVGMTRLASGASGEPFEFASNVTGPGWSVSLQRAWARL